MENPAMQPPETGDDHNPAKPESALYAPDAAATADQPDGAAYGAGKNEQEFDQAQLYQQAVVQQQQQQQQQQQGQQQHYVPQQYQQPPAQQEGGGGPTGAGGGGGGGASSGDGYKIFVGGLSWETNEDSLRNYFEQCGEVLDCVIMRDRHTGHPRGFGFVTFADEQVATAAASRRHDLDGRQVEAKRAVPRNEFSSGGGGGGSGAMGGHNAPVAAASVYGSGPRGAVGLQGPSRGYGGDQAAAGYGGGGLLASGGGAAPGSRAHHTTKCKVFVGGLPSSCGVDEFRSYFQRFGEVVDAQVMIDHNTGNSRGFGFVTFGSEAIVSAVVGPGKSNTDHEIMGKNVEVKRAEPKGAPTDRRSNRDSYSGGSVGSGAAGNVSQMRSSAGPNSDTMPPSGGANGTNAAAAAAAAYYNQYPASLAEQYGAYYNNPQWQQYYAAMGYNFNAYPQGYNPYQYLQAFMNNAASAANGTGTAPGMGASVPGDPAAGSTSGVANAQGYDATSAGAGRYPTAAGDIGQNGGGPGNNGSAGGGGGGPGARRSSRRDDRYHPYR